MDVIITSPSLDPAVNVSGVSAVVRFIIGANAHCRYHHFQIGSRDGEHDLWRRVANTWRTWRAWRRTLAAWPEATVHYSFPLSAPSILRDPLFMWYAKRRGRRMVVHIHGGVFLTASHTPWLLNRVLRWVFSWPVTFIVLGEGERRRLTEHYGARRVSVLPNCVSLTSAARFTRDADAHTLCVGYLGRIEAEKGMEELLEACRALKEDTVGCQPTRKQGIASRLIMAGVETRSGEYLPRFREALGDDFEYAGLVSGDTKDAFLRRMDVFVLPSHFEGLPMSLLEAMSYGAVPVVTPVGSIPQVVAGEGEGQNGIYIKVGDTKSIVAAIKRLSDDPQLTARLSRAARQTIFERFSPDDYVRRLNEIYQTNEWNTTSHTSP